MRILLRKSLKIVIGFSSCISMFFLIACTTNSYEVLNIAESSSSSPQTLQNTNPSLNEVIAKNSEPQSVLPIVTYADDTPPNAVPIPSARPLGKDGGAAQPNNKVQPAPIFGDRKPHQWTGITPWHYEIHGTDVSKYQGAINWPLLKTSGISFVFIKATEGGDHIDDNFATNWQQAKAAYLPRGAYHFYYFCRSARDQAKWFIAHVPRDKTALPPVLDIEWNHTSPTCRIHPDPRKVRSEIGVFLSLLQFHYGKRPIIYTTVDFFDQNDLRLLKNEQFWLRSVAGHPSEKYGSHPWIFWQYTGTGQIAGISGDVDINVYHGSLSDWQSFLGH